ncbi:hypothetical protein ACHHYP_03022 [Achlya hypogyna]|uniref:AB hydrolase-1 domain-containing protein n=1 Tax=Achlya hypogyna TaxID=1202772 RepID=A0A1V9Z4T9_ACHHY|nr:hypothetical protein ACHHYP_03022 [Achlya hypogyna]
MWHPWQLLQSLRRPARVLDKVTTTHHKVLDHVTATLTHNPLLFPQGFFADGWGDLHVPTLLERRLATDDKFTVAPIHDLQWTTVPRLPLRRANAPVVLQGSFRTTLREHEDLLPPVCHTAHCELVLPADMMPHDAAAPIQGQGRALVLILPGTGEHGCTHRRKNVAEPLARAGVATLVLEGPFYGKRKPEKQRGSKLRRVSDLPILGIATIEEAKSLLHHCKQHYNFDHLVVAGGGSMGGLHAAMTAALFPGDVGVASWVAPPSAIPAFTRGLLALSCNWQSLAQQRELAMIDQLLAGHVAHYADLPPTDEVAHVKQRLSAFLALTNIENFPTPRRDDAVVFSQASEDQYIGANEAQWQLVRARWPRAQFRRVTAGHVSGILFETEAFVATILDIIQTLRR